MPTLVGLRGLDSGSHDSGTVIGAGWRHEGGVAHPGQTFNQRSGGEDAAGGLGAVGVKAAEGGVPGEGALEGHWSGLI